MSFFKKHFTKPSRQNDDAPPAYEQATGETYVPPLEPPPSKKLSSNGEDEYLPPPGPPPSKIAGSTSKDGYAPPPGPPPPQAPVHDWQSAVPDTSLLPPPPAAANDFSPSSNASNDEARRAWDWCKKYPLKPPAKPEPTRVELALNGILSLEAPKSRFPGKLTELRDGVWTAATKPGSGDQCFITKTPAYFALSPEAPRISGRMRIVYFELHFNQQGAADNEGNLPSLAIGYVANPYPTWRMPGWERGSFAVHSDDGRRYVNNQDGGQDFTREIFPNTVVGLGIRYWVAAQDNSLRGEVFFTRDGQLDGTWSLQEEMDESSEYGNWGIAGDHDLYPAVGTFGQIGFKAVFAPAGWLFNLNSLPPPGLGV